MSTPSTPRSAHSARSVSPADNSPSILTPGQKIKAMMAQFDSDSESDSQATNSKTSMPKLDFGSKTTSIGLRALQQPDDSDDSEDADEIVRPKGRMAARMQGDADASTNFTEPQQGSAFSRLSNALRTEKEQTQKPTRRSPSPVDDSSDDDLPTAAPRRRTNAQSAQSPASADHDSAESISPARSVSPLFVPSLSPQNDDTAPDHTSDNETHDKHKSNARFLALVAQKRKEREERERIEDEQKAARRAQLEHFSSEIMSGEESEGEEATSAQKLSQKARHPRKASKKALEEMRQETQRLSRNMQLAHQAQTKKKITKESLFARFNFMQPHPSPAEPAAANSSSTAGSQHSSDLESPKKDKQTPHTSPVLGPSDADKLIAIDVAELSAGIDERSANETSTPTIGKANSSTSDTLDAPKELTTLSAKNVPRKPTQPPVRVLLSRQEVARHQKEDSDSDDLEVVTSPSKARRIAAFENLPTRKLQESSSMTTLKALAHLTSPSRKHSGMNSAELSASLLYKARQQAAKERRERIEELKAKGIVIETAEERAAMEDDIENLMEKARQEADEIARKEKSANKKGQGLDDDDDDDDEDYYVSGSDEDGSNGDDNEEEEDNDSNENPGFLDNEADEGDESADDQAEDELSDAEVLAEVSSSRRKRRARVVNDDDEEDEPQVPSTPVRPPSHDPQSVQRPVFPGMETPGGMSMGLTQAFAGTLADDEDASGQPASSTMPFSLPDPGRPVPRLRAEDSEILVRDSQEHSHEAEFMTGYTQNVTRVSESPAAHKFSQHSQLPDPTQDQGFIYSPFDPNKRFRESPPVSTVDTVLLQSQSPIAERKSRQLRRGRAANLSMVEEDENEGDFEINPNAFNVMKKAAKKESVPYDKKNSKAKNIVDEAAEESEDEYAGLGGASDDSEGEEDAYDQQMINDQSGEVVDEKQLAAMNA
jgi:mediator of replication checkpoint protein 1